MNFEAEAEPTASLRVYKTRTTTRTTLAEGTFRAHEILKYEAGRPAESRAEWQPAEVLRSEALTRVGPPGQRFGYDVIAHVGLARFVRNLQRKEIRGELLSEYGIPISTGSVSNLCDRFLSLLEALHLKRLPGHYAHAQQGYPLHLDATCEKGRGGLAVCMDGRRGWVLMARRVPSEHHEHLRPLVNDTVAAFGDPIATMRDLGKAVGSAVQPLRERGIADLVCHYHFARAVGTRLLEKPRADLRRCGHDAFRVIRAQVSSLYRESMREVERNARNPDKTGRVGVRESLLALLLWLVEGQGRLAPFPFDVPEFELMRRGRCIARMADDHVAEPRNDQERTILAEVMRLLHLLDAPDAVEAYQRCEQARLAFGELRAVLRLTNAQLPGHAESQQPELPAIDYQRLEEIEQAVKTYRQGLEQRVHREREGTRGNGRAPKTPDAIILSYLDTYQLQLFGHPATYDDNGAVISVMDRTNNRLEQQFGTDKRNLRRRLGKAHLARDMEQAPAAAALVSNLRHPDYVRVLCGSIENLHRAFAEINPNGEFTRPALRSTPGNNVRKRIRKMLQDGVPVPAATPTSRPWIDPTPSPIPF